MHYGSKSVACVALAVLLGFPVPLAAHGPALSGSIVPAAGEVMNVASPTNAQDGADRQIQDWHDRLHITPAQEPQWESFAAAMRVNLQHLRAARAERRRAVAGSTAVDEMQRYAKAAQDHADDVQRVVIPFERLYGVLSQEQRGIADKAFRQLHDQERRMHRRFR